MSHQPFCSQRTTWRRCCGHPRFSLRKHDALGKSTRHARKFRQVEVAAAEAPDLVDKPAGVSEPQLPEPPSGPPSLRRLVRILEKRLSNLQLAIAEMALLAGLSAVGTVIEQDQTDDWYVLNFPDGPDKVLGFLDFHTVFALQLDHIYTSYYFLGIGALLAASLIACSRTQQLPLVKVARRWRFARSSAEVFRKGNGETLPAASVRDLGSELVGRGYRVFLRDGALYAFKGLAGRLAPIGVHVSLLAILLGATIGAVAGLEGIVMIPQGSSFVVADVMRARLPMVPLPDGAQQAVTVDNFTIEYQSDGSISQYRSLLRRNDLDGRLSGSKEIYVNEPMRFGGITIYQTDWGMAAMTLRSPNSPLSPEGGAAYNVPLTELSTVLGMNAKSKLYGTFVPVEMPVGTEKPKGITVLARDLEQVAFYDNSGAFVGVRRPGSGKPINMDGVDFIVDEIIGSTGLQLKSDPGVPFVYTGFGFLMITSIISYLSHSQVWALQEGSDLHVGGRTNRAIASFKEEYSSILDAIPERSL